MEDRLNFPSIRAHLARAVFIPLALAVGAFAMADLVPLGAPYNGGVAMGLVLAAVGYGMWRFIQTTESLEIAVEQATLAMRHMSTGEPLPSLRLPHMREPAELLIATRELQDYLTVMVIDDSAESPEAEARDAVDDLIARLRSTCEQLSECSVAPAPEKTAGAASVHAPALRPAEAIGSRDRVLALRQQAERLILLATPFHHPSMGSTRRAAG